MLRYVLPTLLLVACSGGSPDAPDESAQTGAETSDQAVREERESPSACSPEGAFTVVDDGQPDVVGPNGERPIGISKEYTFAANTYRMEGYPPLVVTGSWAIAERDGMRVRVAFTDTIFDGSPHADRDRWLTFTDCDHFEMDGMTYARRAP